MGSLATTFSCVINKSLLPLLIICTLLAVPFQAKAQSFVAKIYIDPPNIIDPALRGTVFTIEVKIANVTDLYAFDFKLHYDKNILIGVGARVVPFRNETHFTSYISINDTEGLIHVNVTYYPPATPITQYSPITVASIIFQATNVGTSILHLYDTVLTDAQGSLILHTTEDGYFDNRRYPIALFNYKPSKPMAGEIVVFNASASYAPDGKITSYNWDFGDGQQGTGNVTTHIYTRFGEYQVNLTVTDNEGAMNFTGAKITVIESPEAYFTFSPRTPQVGQTINFNASLSRFNGGYIMNFTWNFGDGNITTAISPLIAHIYSMYGNYTVTLRVIDSEGLTSTYTQTIKVLVRPYVDFTYIPASPVVNEVVTFNASASYDPDGKIISYEWNFGEGGEPTNETTPVSTHAFQAAGSFSVTLTVTDNDGLTTNKTEFVTVGKISSNISISSTGTTITLGESLVLSGKIAPSREGALVTVYSRLKGTTTWNIIDTVKTNQTGQYAYTWTSGNVGEFEVKTIWAGDSITLSAESSPLTVEVQAIAGNGLPLNTLLYAIATLTIALVAAIALYYRRFRRSKLTTPTTSAHTVQQAIEKTREWLRNPVSTLGKKH